MKQIYSIRQGTTILELMDVVNQDMAMGWMPQGGLCVSAMPSGYPMPLYSHAMVLEMDENVGKPTP